MTLLCDIWKHSKSSHIGKKQVGMRTGCSLYRNVKFSRYLLRAERCSQMSTPMRDYVWPRGRRPALTFTPSQRQLKPFKNINNNKKERNTFTCVHILAFSRSAQVKASASSSANERNRTAANVATPRNSSLKMRSDFTEQIDFELMSAVGFNDSQWKWWSSHSKCSAKRKTQATNLLLLFTVHTVCCLFEHFEFLFNWKTMFINSCPLSVLNIWVFVCCAAIKI